MQNVPNKITDSDLLHTLLLYHKHMCEEALHAMLECSNQQLRQDLQQSLQTTLNHQQQIGQLMQRKGYYRALPASQQEQQAAMTEVQKILQASAAGAGGAGAGQPLPGMQPQPGMQPPQMS